MTAQGADRSLLRFVDAHAVSAAVRKETRNREIHLPPISVYRWWARRTESEFGALIDAATSHFPEGSLLIADPFVGGGIIPLAAVSRHHRVYAQDLNPWAVSGLGAMLSLPSAHALRAATRDLRDAATPLLRKAYATTGSDETPATISHTLRVASAECSACGHRSRLFPHATVTLLVRKERQQTGAFIACPNGHLFQGDIELSKACPSCGCDVDPSANYTARRRVVCVSCAHHESLEDRAENRTWAWEVVLVERATDKTREIAVPRPNEIAQADESTWRPSRKLGRIPPGQETKVLCRHGFTNWEDLYPPRQRVVTEALLRLCDEILDDVDTRRACRMAVLGTVEMAGFLSRWDRWYLKSYESMAGHRFNFTTLSAEPNVWGTKRSGRGTVRRRMRLLEKAAEWLDAQVGRGLNVEIAASTRRRRTSLKLDVDARIVEGSSERMLLPSNSVDLILTDPPYHDDVQYDELSLPLRAWAGLPTTALDGEAVVSSARNLNTGADDYRDLLTRIFREARRTLKSEGHFVLSYANREPNAWVNVFSALQSAGLRAIGYEILHSENETSPAKRDSRACTLDLIMDLVPENETPVEQWRPAASPDGDEREFLELVGSAFLEVGQLGEDWGGTFVQQLRASAFLQSPDDAKEEAATRAAEEATIAS